MKNYINHIFLLFTGILWGTITVSAQILTNLGFSLYETSLYTMIFSVVILLPIMIVRRNYLFKKSEIKFFVSYGLIQALLQTFQMGGVLFGAPVAVVAFLINTQPIYTTIFGRFLFSEDISKKKILTILIAILGIFVLLKPWDIKNVGSTLGIIFGLMAGIFLSLWVVYGRISGLDKKNPIKSTFGMFLFSAFWLILFAPLFLITKNANVIKFISYPLNDWIYVIIISFIAFVLPAVIFYKGIEKVPASTAGVILLLEPISASILAAILFDQPITSNIIIGGILILLSNYLIIPKREN
jgi:drug/metabolite transporter (DMT)-like permease